MSHNGRVFQFEKKYRYLDKNLKFPLRSRQNNHFLPIILFLKTFCKLATFQEYHA